MFIYANISVVCYWYRDVFWVWLGKGWNDGGVELSTSSRPLHSPSYHFLRFLINYFTHQPVKGLLVQAVAGASSTIFFFLLPPVSIKNEKCGGLG